MTRIKKTIILIGAAAMVAFSFSSCATTIAVALTVHAAAKQSAASNAKKVGL